MPDMPAVLRRLAAPLPWLLAALLLLPACGDDDPSNSPPRVRLESPADGAHLTEPTLVTASAEDDRGVASVRFRLDGDVFSRDFDAPWEAALPVGVWADGAPHELTAEAEDTDAARTTSGPVTVTIDPSLQTIPQLLAVDTDPVTFPGQLRLRWLSFPGALEYTYEIHATDRLDTLLLAGTTADTLVTTVWPSAGIHYVRVRAETPTIVTPWSRTVRQVLLPEAGVHRVVDAGRQTPGRWAAVLPSGELAALSHGGELRNGAPMPAVYWRLTPGGEALVETLVDLDGPAVHGVALTPDSTGVVVAAGDTAGAYLLRLATASGQEQWRTSPTDHDLRGVTVAPDGTILAVGRDLADVAGEEGVVVAYAPDGQETGRVAFALDEGQEPTAILRLAGGDVILAGDHTALGGVWVQRRRPDGELVWRLRSGTADDFRLLGAARNERDDVCLVGADEDGAAWAAAVAADGRYLWLRRDSGFEALRGVAAGPYGRWLVAGQRHDGNRRLLTVAGLGPAGDWRWRASHAAGDEAIGFAVARLADGSLATVGAVSSGGGAYDVLLVHTDDRGEIPQ